MYYEKLKEKKINHKDHRNALIEMGYLTKEKKIFSCWCLNSSTSMIDFEYNPMLPNRFWISIKDDMLFICESGFNGKVLAYFGNIELKNIRYVQKKYYNRIFPCFIFQVKNESGVNNFRIIPAHTKEIFNAKEITKYIIKYHSKDGEKYYDL